ncbi:DNA primase [Granulicoccus phenolivorans]|uniref:DNA primase n=1 Tax=Granulicoccus phenolivorans TaxID=266854 RepID=UPI00047E6FFA|nr:DNA primase [Granulicoccus phenolivorans]
MAGRIRDEDVAEVRARARIDEVVSGYLTLKNAGGGSLKGLCPFHSEKTPSFQVTPSRGLYYCFGCGEGGDVITFLQKVDNLSFAEAVEQLADRVGVQLRYADGSGPGTEPGLRTQILEANAAAAEYFAEQLTGADALPGRQFLDQRGFDRSAAEHFSIGWAPQGGKQLGKVLRERGFRPEVLVRAGLVRENGWDFFQGRLLWPIRDSGRHVLGFGARRILDEDRIPAKYINTPETPVYKKSHVLYGLDLARQQIGKKAQAVVVEGYTDVMAAHLSGVDTAVASCGTAFGADHAKLLQRLMGNHDAFHGEVIFTFDGDAAGQAAAIKVFNLDRTFITQTYVAVEPTGLDPCDLRLQSGPEAVRELVGRRVPLYRFVMRNVLDSYDLDRADGRLAALRAAAPLVGSIRDASLVDAYVRELSGMLGMDLDTVRAAVHRARSSRPGEDAAVVVEPKPDRTQLPDPDDRELEVERDTLKLLLQRPQLFGADWEISAEDFTHPGYRALYAATEQARDAEGDWTQRVLAICGHGLLGQLAMELSVEPLLHEPDAAYVDAYRAKLQLLTCVRRIGDLKSKLQRTNPVENQSDYNRQFGELLSLERTRKQLQARSLGGITL